MQPLANTYEVEPPPQPGVPAPTRALIKAEKDFADFVLRTVFLRESVGAALCVFL